MPSHHLSWALWCSLALWPVVRRRLAPQPAAAVPARHTRRDHRHRQPSVRRPRRQPRRGRDRVRRRHRDRARASRAERAREPDRGRAGGTRSLTPVHDAVVIGSGFGGAMAAHELVHAGLDVLMLERGDWVERGPHNWDDAGSVDLTPSYSNEAPYRVAAGGNGPTLGSYSCVGGPSVFYGGRLHPLPRSRLRRRSRHRRGLRRGLAVRLRRRSSPGTRVRQKRCSASRDERRGPDRAARAARRTRTRPARCRTRRRAIAGAARALGLSPFRLPLAINYSDADGRTPCVACTTCDTFACAISAKNDLATTVLPALLERGLELRANTVVTRIVAGDGRVEGVECYDKRSGRREVVRARSRARRRGRARHAAHPPGVAARRGQPRRAPGRPPPHAALQRDRVRRVPDRARIRAVSSTSRSASTTSTSGRRRP